MGRAIRRLEPYFRDICVASEVSWRTILVLEELFHAPRVTVIVWLDQEPIPFLIELARLLEVRPQVIACGASIAGLRQEAQFLALHMRSKGIYVHRALDDLFAQACRNERKA